MVKTKRNIGIELLRIFAMLMVVITHFNTQGGLINNATLFSSQYYVSWSFMVLSYSAVNCYALISGYVGVDNNKKGYSRIITLWLNVLFYTVLITLFFFIFARDKVGIMEWIKAFTPASSGQYWFFSAYFILFFLMPFLNQLVNFLDNKKRFILVITLVLIFSIIPTLRQTDAFVLNSGYSPLWLITLYLIGGCVKKSNFLEKITTKWWLIILFSTLIIIFASKFGIEYILFLLTGEARGGGIFLSYISPLVIIIALALLALFSRIEVKNNKLSKVILLVSGSTFSVYIMHEHPLIKHQFLIDAFVPLLQNSPVLLALKVIGIAIIVFIVLTLIDLIRVGLFKVAKVNKIAQSTNDFIGNCFYKIYKRLAKL